MVSFPGSQGASVRSAVSWAPARSAAQASPPSGSVAQRARALSWSSAQSSVLGPGRSADGVAWSIPIAPNSAAASSAVTHAITPLGWRNVSSSGSSSTAASATSPPTITDAPNPNDSQRQT